MIRGLSFEIPNEYGRYLELILQSINLENYEWVVGHGESYQVVNEELGSDLFSSVSNTVSGTELSSIIKNKDYYLIFVDLKAHHKGKIKPILTYDEFLKSDCELVILIVDSFEVTIYCKREKDLEQFYNNVIKNGFDNVEAITEINDYRTTLRAW